MNALEMYYITQWLLQREIYEIVPSPLFNGDYGSPLSVHEMVDRAPLLLYDEHSLDSQI